MRVLVVIPAYNEAGNLAPLIARIRSECPGYDILVVNDGSDDDTSAVARQSGADVIDLPINLGIGGAVQSGIMYAQYNDYDAAVQVDGDGQHDPAFIRVLADELAKGADLCIGSRFISNTGFRSTSIRRLGIKYFSRLIKLLAGIDASDPTSGFRAYNRNAINLFAADYPRDYPEPESIVNAAGNGLKISERPVVMGIRLKGRSSITIIRSAYYMVKVSLAVIITSLSVQRNTKEYKR